MTVYKSMYTFIYVIEQMQKEEMGREQQQESEVLSFGLP